MRDLPEYIKVCGLCDGRGGYEQRYCDGPGGAFSMYGPCGLCKGQGYVYKATGAPVGDSVLAQIEAAPPPVE